MKATRRTIMKILNENYRESIRKYIKENPLDDSLAGVRPALLSEEGFQVCAEWASDFVNAYEKEDFYKKAFPKLKKRILQNAECFGAYAVIFNKRNKSHNEWGAARIGLRAWLITKPIYQKLKLNKPL